jgi:hypothetical protein
VDLATVIGALQIFVSQHPAGWGDVHFDAQKSATSMATG